MRITAQLRHPVMTSYMNNSQTITRITCISLFLVVTTSENAGNLNIPRGQGHGNKKSILTYRVQMLLDGFPPEEQAACVVNIRPLQMSSTIHRGSPVNSAQA